MRGGRAVAAVALLGLGVHPVRAGWADMGECSYRVTGDFVYHESFRLLDNGVDSVTVVKVGWDQRYVWGTGTSDPYWILHRPARSQGVERLSSEGRWHARLAELGVPVPPEIAPVWEYRPWHCELVEIRDGVVVLFAAYAYWLLRQPALLLAAMGTAAILVALLRRAHRRR